MMGMMGKIGFIVVGLLAYHIAVIWAEPINIIAALIIGLWATVLFGEEDL